MTRCQSLNRQFNPCQQPALPMSFAGMRLCRTHLRMLAETYERLKAEGVVK